MAKFYYNGILLPEIPSSILANYPYVFIRNNASTGYYDLIGAVQPFYYDASETRLVDAGGTTDAWYRIKISTAASATSWGSAQSHSYIGWTIDTSRPVLWSNTNIYREGTTSSYPLYFASSSPIPENAIVNTTGTFLIDGETLSDIANAIRLMTGTVAPITVSNMATLIKTIGRVTSGASTASTYGLRQNLNNG